MQPGIEGDFDVNDLNLEEICVLVPSALVDVTGIKNCYCAMVLMHACCGAKIPLHCIEAQEAAAIVNYNLLGCALF